MNNKKNLRKNNAAVWLVIGLLIAIAGILTIVGMEYATDPVRGVWHADTNVGNSIIAELGIAPDAIDAELNIPITVRFHNGEYSLVADDGAQKAVEDYIEAASDSIVAALAEKYSMTGDELEEVIQTTHGADAKTYVKELLQSAVSFSESGTYAEMGDTLVLTNDAGQELWNLHCGFASLELENCTADSGLMKYAELPLKLSRRLFSHA